MAEKDTIINAAFGDGTYQMMVREMEAGNVHPEAEKMLKHRMKDTSNAGSHVWIIGRPGDTIIRFCNVLNDYNK